MLKPIKPKRISDQVFEQLKDLIFRGHFKPGEKLMTERELAQALGISRPTVREAINKLVSMGIVEHRQGQGTFVNSPSDDSEKNPLAAIIQDRDFSLMDLLEVRLGLECNAATLAAARATEEDIQALQKSLDEMISEIEAGGLGSGADVSFHMAIAFATQNGVHIRIMRSLYDLMFYGIKQNLQHLYEKPENLKTITQQHTRVFEAIRRHDPDGAFHAMKEHITYVMTFFRERELT
jgi:GntR family transcriptional regulator, transcriptional repressor for pyruvate dehydrogenase complex